VYLRSQEREKDVVVYWSKHGAVGILCVHWVVWGGGGRVGGVCGVCAMFGWFVGSGHSTSQGILCLFLIGVWRRKKTGWWGKEEKELGIHNHLTHMRGVLGGIVVDLSEKTENSWRRRITPYGYIV